MTAGGDRAQVDEAAEGRNVDRERRSGRKVRSTSRSSQREASGVVRASSKDRVPTSVASLNASRHANGGGEEAPTKRSVERCSGSSSGSSSKRRGASREEEREEADDWVESGWSRCSE